MKRALFLFFLLMVSSRTYSQDIVQLIRFESATQSTLNGERIQKLFNARLSMRNVTLVCDSAYRFLDRDEMRAYGNIQIDTDSTKIWADSLYYFSNKDVSLLRGRVVIRQDSATLFGSQVDYNFETKEAVFPQGIRLEDKKGVLVARQGEYYEEQDSAVFRFDVQVQDTSQYVEGDSLFINRKTDYFQIYDDVFISDSTNKAILTGQYVESDSTGRRYVEGNSYLMKVEADSLNSDTTHIHAYSLLLLDEDSTNIIRGYRNVSLWSEKFSSLSDSLNYNSQTELFKLSGKPKAWNRNIQLNGPFIAVQLDSNQVKQLKAYAPAFAVQEDTITLRLNQLKGDTLIADFDSSEISQILLSPNSEMLYHTKNDNDEPDGAMENSSPSTTLLFEHGELKRAIFGKNQGLFLPEYAELPNRRLDGFSWDPELRPQKPTSIPVPRLTPIPEDRPFELPKRFILFLEELEKEL